MAQGDNAATQKAAKQEMAYSNFPKGLLKEEAAGRNVRKQSTMTRLIDGQITALGVVRQADPVLLHVRQRAAKRAAWRHTRQRCLHPIVQRRQGRHTLLLARLQPGLVGGIFVVALDVVSANYLGRPR